MKSFPDIDFSLDACVGFLWSPNEGPLHIRFPSVLAKRDGTMMRGFASQAAIARRLGIDRDRVRRAYASTAWTLERCSFSRAW